MPEEYLTIVELCDRMRISPSKVKQLRRERGLPSVTWGSRTVRYPWGKVEAWIEEEMSNVG